MGDRSLSSIFLSCFSILFHDSTALTVIEYLPYVFMGLPCVELEVSWLCRSEEKLKYVLKINGDKLFKHFLTNKYFLGKFYLGTLRWKFA